MGLHDKADTMPRDPAGEDALGNALPVFDEAVCSGLARMLGQQRLQRMMTAFFRDAEARLAALDQPGATAAELGDHAHALLSMAGHLGFLRLSSLCGHTQESARRGGGLEHRAALRAALAEAREAARDTFDDGAGTPLALLPTARPPVSAALSPTASWF